MNILIIGGHGTISKCLIHQLLNKKINFKVICYDNNNNNGKNLYDDYQYLEEDCVSFIYGDICDNQKIENIINENKINVIINGIKYNPERSFETNFEILVNGYNSLCRLSSIYNIKLINIYRFISGSYYNFKHIRSHVKRQIKEIHKMQKIMNNLFDEHKNKNIYNIIYHDYLYHNEVYVNNIIDKYIKMFMIGDKPYFQNIDPTFNDVNEIISIIFSIGLFNESKKYHEITGYKYSMINVIAPQIKNILKQNFPEKNFNYHNEIENNNSEQFIKYSLVQSIKNTINKMYVNYK